MNFRLIFIVIDVLKYVSDSPQSLEESTSYVNVPYRFFYYFLPNETEPNLEAETPALHYIHRINVPPGKQLPYPIKEGA